MVVEVVVVEEALGRPDQERGFHCPHLCLFTGVDSSRQSIGQDRA